MTVRTLLRNLAVAVVAVALVVPVLGAGGGAALSFVLAGVAGLAAYGLVLRRRGLPARDVWATSAPAAPLHGVSGSLVTAAPRALRSSSPRRIALAIARMESREWLRSPWYAAGIAFCITILVVFGWVFTGTEDAGVPWREVLVLAPVFAHPMTGMVVIGAHAATTRARRDGVEEILDACPVGPTPVTVGRLVAGWVPAATIAVFLAATYWSMARNAPGLFGALGPDALPGLLVAVVIGWCGSALGIALGRWLPWRIVPVVAVGLLAVVILGVGALGHPHFSNLRQLSTWPRFPSHDLVFTAAPVWWHLVWIMALGALVSALALARGGGRGAVTAVVAISVLVAFIAVAMTRPISTADAARIASMVANPAHEQQCAQRPHLRVCTYRDYTDYATAMADELGPVAAQLPAAHPEITLRQRFDGRVAELGPEVRAALDGRRLDRDDAITLGFSSAGPERDALRLRVGLRAVGIATRRGSVPAPRSLAGEARGVVALWLAVQGLGRRDAEDLLRPAPKAVTPTERGQIWPDPCYAGEPPVTWAPEDLAAAKVLLARADTAHVVRRDWSAIVAPSTTTQDLLARFGVEAPATSPIRPEPVHCDWT